MRDTTVTKVSSAHSPKGKMGQKYLVSGVALSMRLWQEEPGDPKPETERGYETVGYVIGGRAELHLELAGRLVVDAGADDVGRHQVGRELHPVEVAADGLRERLDGERLGQAGHALDQHVAAGQQGYDQPFEQDVLAHDGLLDLVEHLLDRAGRGGGREAARHWERIIKLWPLPCGQRDRLSLRPRVRTLRTAKRLQEEWWFQASSGWVISTNTSSSVAFR